MKLPMQEAPGLEIICDVVYIFDFDSRPLQTKPDRLVRQATTLPHADMLDALELLLFNSGDDAAVFKDRGRGTVLMPGEA
jgi:hypothetical protein